jgi:hypothetical protein
MPDDAHETEHQDENPDAPASDQDRMTGRPSGSLEAEEAAGFDVVCLSGRGDKDLAEAVAHLDRLDG